MNDPAILALTPHGLELAQRLVKGLNRGEAILVAGSAREQLTDLFLAGRPMICIMALGIVVRILGPLMKDKETDPPVVVVDEAGRFAIPVLGGHGAGANDLAREAAQAIDAIAVITSASDVLGLPALDLIGRDWGWKIEGREDLTQLSAAVIRGEPIAVYQDAGRRNWWQSFGDWPGNFQRIECLASGNWTGLLVISDLCHSPLPCPTIVYRPPTLVLGIGCQRGVPCAEIEAMFQEVCQTRGFSPLSLGMVATASIKADEPGLQEFCTMHGVPLRSFSLDELAQVPDLPTPSERVRAKIGVRGVAEPAAMLAASTRSLLMSKYRGQRITMAVARREA